VTSFEPSGITISGIGRFLGGELRDAIETESQASQLTALIPMESRTAPGLPWANEALGAPASSQGMLFQYRRCVFMFNSICAFVPEVGFHRGHESCPVLGQPCTLTRVKRRQKQKTQSALVSDHKFTDMDYLLNKGQLVRAVAVLSDIRQRLRVVYKEAQTVKT
jgi:hypothetical protein